ncbi:MAG: cobalamin biosynthesis protein CbiM [Candidatus Aminicenantes bacterium]|nr:cobalamin biosynthesis protein CbiM [Candidatus Aminicenantes bacterium]
MHIADGILSTEMAAAADAVSVGALYVFGKRARTEEIPKMGIMAAALFVVSLIHFPVAGTSVHLGLFGLAGILLGFRAVPVVFTALLFQSLLFQHGGLLSLGVNVINMSAGAVAAYFLWRIRPVPEALRAFLCGFVGIIVPALLMAVEFELSGYGRGIYYLMSIYVIAAGAEGILSAMIIGFFRKVDPRILPKYPVIKEKK